MANYTRKACQISTCCAVAYPMQMLLISFQSCCRIEAEYVCDKQRKVSMVRNMRSPKKCRDAR